MNESTLHHCYGSFFERAILKVISFFIYDLSYKQLIMNLISELYKLEIQEKRTMVQNYGIAISQLRNTQLEKKCK